MAVGDIDHQNEIGGYASLPQNSTTHEIRASGLKA